VLWTGFDISIVARNYAQLAGVLAGFAFVVINLVLDRGYRRRGNGKSRAALEVEHETLTGVALMNAFLGLFLSAIQYSLLAGENGCSLTGGRAASAELLGGISFVASVYMLLYAVVQFVSGSAETLAKHCVFIVAVLVPPIAVFFIEATISDLALALADPTTRQPLQPLWNDANNLSVPIALAVLVVAAAVWLVGRKTRLSETPSALVCRSSALACRTSRWSSSYRPSSAPSRRYRCGIPPHISRRARRGCGWPFSLP
jgi:hypothetical protein